MALTINTNIASLNAQRQLNGSQQSLQTSMQRLSSGLRINSAADDAAGLAISDRMTAQVDGLTQAQRNANDGISVVQTAEGALGQITNALQTMRTLSVQAASDSNTATDRLSIQKQVSQLQQQITQIATQTQFNGKSVLDGSFTAQKFQIGAYADQNLSVSIGGTRANDIGANSLETSALTVSGTSAQASTGTSVFAVSASGATIANQTLTITGATGTPTTVTLASGTTQLSAKSVADAVNGAAASTAVNATAITEAYLSGLSTSGTFSLSLYGSNQASSGSSGIQVTASVTNSSDLSSLASAINNVASATGITASLSADKSGITLIQSQGYNIGVENFKNASGATGAAAGGTINVQTVDASSTSTLATGAAASGFLVGAAATLTAGTASGSANVVGTLAFNSSSGYSITTSASGTLFGAGTESSTLADVGSASVATQQQANDAIKRIDGALSFVDNLQATLGSIQNRFTSVISNMQATSVNVSAAQSRIQDTDFAAETSALSRAQILQQAGTAMLAQANASSQNVLTLLR